MKRPIFLFVLLLLVAFVPVLADDINTPGGWPAIGGLAGKIIGGGLMALVIGWFAKKIPYDKVELVFEKAGYFIGVAMTAGGTKFLKSLWNKTVEPILQLILRRAFGGFVNGLIDGLDSDDSG